MVGFHVATPPLLSFNTVSILNPCNSMTSTKSNFRVPSYWKGGIPSSNSTGVKQPDKKSQGMSLRESLPHPWVDTVRSSFSFSSEQARWIPELCSGKVFAMKELYWARITLCAHKHHAVTLFSKGNLSLALKCYIEGKKKDSKIIECKNAPNFIIAKYVVVMSAMVLIVRQIKYI